jgi:rod shape-determining protein MreC
MRNILLFINRYSHLIVLLLLQGLSLHLLFRYNRFHEAVFSNSFNELTGRVRSGYSGLEEFFSLRQENGMLREENARLRNMLKSDYAWPDSSSSIVNDTIRIDTLVQYRKFVYMPAGVIGNSVNLERNHIMLHRGSRQGVETGMAVTSPSGVLGTVIGVSENMSVVMSLLHAQTRIVAVLKRGGGYGEVSWDGKDPRYVQLTKIPQTTIVKKGDSVVTSQFSDKYPPGQLVGFVERISEDPQSGTYNLNLRTAVDFRNVHHAYIIRNLQQQEMDALKQSLKEGNE